ncbi:DNA-binding GntR family transcriptional regulator [Tepidamorphus gemmatus]|uniref:DNA-binding GntR family transcriptional regulator n=1 Tax=Tepidamorphus gemmatus TaxID=747076 RepID=A0A4R3MGW2_9HYPH|nr:DNA-binding GntR family transcriptional regulator [Tepidamorphus gemmatus]
MLDSTSEEVYGAIRRDIIHGVLAPRARLRLEALRESYGAGLSTLREVLNRLVGERLVVVEGQRGFAVAPVTQAEFSDLASLRELLEVHALRESFRKGDLEWEGQVVGAYHKLGRIEARMLDGDRSQSELWKRYDKEFHHRLIAACASAELLAAHASVFDRYLRYQIIAVIFRGTEAAEEHRMLRDCALARDADRAIQVLAGHIAACVEHTAALGLLASDGDSVAQFDPPRETVAASVWRKVRGDILSGALVPGRKLRLEGLRDQYGASVSTLREVLNRLATEGLVLAEGQRGFEVVQVSPENLRELAELRLLVEGQALADSFRRGDVDWEARVVAAYHKLAAMEKRMDQGDRSQAGLWKRHDWEFHQALISACGSDVLMHLHGGIFDKYLRYQMIALSFRGSIAAAEHRALLEASLARDADAAKAILETHLIGGVEHALASGSI